MKKLNVYYKTGIIGLIANFLLVIVLSYVFDPIFASIFSAFFPVWIIILVVGWRTEHPRR